MRPSFISNLALRINGRIHPSFCIDNPSKVCEKFAQDFFLTRTPEEMEKLYSFAEEQQVSNELFITFRVKEKKKLHRKLSENEMKAFNWNNVIWDIYPVTLSQDEERSDSVMRKPHYVGRCTILFEL